MAAVEKEPGRPGGGMRQHTEPARPAAGPLIEPSLFYDPPYERPVEDEFAWHLVKYLTPISALDYGVKFDTLAGPLWVTFVVEHAGKRYGFECGELDEEADERELLLRDALLVGSGALDRLYRLRGEDLLLRMHDCLYLASRWDPELFSARGHVNLRTLSSSEARAVAIEPSTTVARVHYEAPEVSYGDDAWSWPGEENTTLVLRRLDRGNPASWIDRYEQALTHFGLSSDEIEQQWKKAG